MKVWIGFVALVGMLGSGAVSAAKPTYDGNELLVNCQQYIKVMDGEKNFDGIMAGVCGGFVPGVQSTVAFFSEDLKNNDRFCTPVGVTNGQLVRIVVKYLKDNPKLLNQNRTYLTWSALKDAYPCK